MTEKRKPKVIRLKTWPMFYDAVFRGEKTFEIRKNDRDFQVDDVLELELFDPEWTDITRPSVPPVMRYTVTYITAWEQAPGMVVMGLKENDAPAPRIYTHKRMFDMVRYMRAELHEANLITDAEYGWLVGEAPLAKGQGSPSPRRLEDYDELNERLQRYEKELADLRVALEAIHATKRGSLLEMAQDLGESLSACYAAIAADVTKLITNDIVDQALGNQPQTREAAYADIWRKEKAPVMRPFGDPESRACCAICGKDAEAGCAHLTGKGRVGCPAPQVGAQTLKKGDPCDTPNGAATFISEVGGVVNVSQNNFVRGYHKHEVTPITPDEAQDAQPTAG
jgi:hypothetical protein